MSFHSSKLRIRSLTPAVAAVLLHIGTAAASDAQEQARALLLGVTPPPHPTTQSAVSTHRATGDAQESARRLLLGATTPSSGPQEAADLSRATGKRLHGDAQVLAREVLLGRRNALATGS